MLFYGFERYAAFTQTHAGLTTRYRTKSLYKCIFVLSRLRDIILYEEDIKLQA